MQINVFSTISHFEFCLSPGTISMEWFESSVCPREGKMCPSYDQNYTITKFIELQTKGLLRKFTFIIIETQYI